MALSARLEMRQGQQLVMTPQLQQAIRLLQLSNLELNAFVEQELERNPLLERDENSEAPMPITIDTPVDGPAEAAMATARLCCPSTSHGRTPTRRARSTPPRRTSTRMRLVESCWVTGPTLGSSHWSQRRWRRRQRR